MGKQVGLSDLDGVLNCSVDKVTRLGIIQIQKPKKPIGQDTKEARHGLPSQHAKV